MTPREIVLMSLRKTEQPITPWQLDLTDEVRDRLIRHFNDPDFEEKIGNSLAHERNELKE